MKWNNAKETKKFERRQAELRVQYLKAGMTEEQIHEMYLYDKDRFLAERREAEHTQSFNFEGFDENVSDEGKNPLLDKFLEALTVEMEHSQSTRFAWVEEIDNPKLAKALKELDDDDLELLTKILIDGLSQSEIARNNHCDRSSISRKIMRIKNFLKKFL